jgi:ABC-type Mn2+/Zn2+ transport system ATPase subunit
MSVPTIINEPARLEFEGVAAGYPGGALALEDVSFQIPHGAQVAMIGPNGAGKSTLFKAMVGLVPVRAGRILIHGLPLNAHRDCLAYVPQREEVDWRFPVTVKDVVMMGRYHHLKWPGRPGRKDRELVRAALDQLGLADLAGRPISDLSGGQQQRVFIARALAQEPHILLMDEPFTGVDAATVETTLRLLPELRKRGVTLIVSTHDLAMAWERFETILLINKRVVGFGRPAEVLTTGRIQEAFGGQALLLDGGLGGVLIDRCCPEEH